ncbi:CbtA family protein [soil metagenome]
MNARTFLIYGLAAGFLAGIFAFGVAHQLGEPYVRQSITLEEATSSHELTMEAPVVSREDQSTLGLATGTIAIGTALGGIAGIASAFAAGRLGKMRPAATTAVVAAVGFASFALATWAKYPANPPGVGNPETLSARTADYFTFQAISVLIAIAAVCLAVKLSRAYDGWIALVVPAIGWLVLVTVAGLVLPTVNEVPDTFPATTLWGFRLSSIAIQAALWGGIGITLSGLVTYKQGKLGNNPRNLVSNLSS